MGSKKYRVEQEGQFLGHYSAHNPAEAVSKAIAANERWNNYDIDKSFSVTRGSKTVELGVK